MGKIGEIKRRVCNLAANLVTSRIAVNRFHRLYYDSQVWVNTHWLGTKCEKCPLDLWIYQEIINDLKPDLVIESGTCEGGSALFLATICDLVNRGKIITIDIQKRETPKHERIKYIIGSSVAEQTVKEIRGVIKDNMKVLVILDSDHSMKHVLKELRIYSQFVSVGSYLIVEDTNMNGHPILPGSGPGPMEAVDEFLRENDSFKIDKSKEKFYLTFNPNGYLLRVK
ncbi:MAG: CmcI family methyltransferase [Planctomycetota bacterium]|jgi:cephalosporin hydroxylase